MASLFYYSITNHRSILRELASSSDQARLEIYNRVAATAAVRPFDYDCVIPVDGLIARGDYEHEFTLHQFTFLPAGAAQKFKITQFDKINVT